MSDLEKAKALSDLTHSVGWKLFQEYIHSVSLVHQMKTFAESATAHEVAKSVGAYNATRHLGEWALNTAMQYKSRLANESKP